MREHLEEYLENWEKTECQDDVAALRDQVTIELKKYYQMQAGWIYSSRQLPPALCYCLGAP